MNKTLYKRTSSGKIQMWNVAVVLEHYDSDIPNARIIYEYGQQDGKHQTKDVLYTHGKNINRSNETTPYEQAVLDAKSDIRSKLTSGYKENINQIDDIDEIPKPMLAHEYLKHSSKVEKYEYVFMQPKIDGFRCLANIKTGLLFTRHRKIIDTMPHISKEIIKYGKYLKSSFFPNANIDLVEWTDGELFADNITFQTLSSIIRKSNHPQQHIVKYNIFDIVMDEEMPIRKDLLSRMRYNDTIINVFTHQVPVKEINSYHKMFIRNGYEGSMIRLPNYNYEHKRSHGLLKLKDFFDKEYKIIGVEKEKGKNTLGAFVLVDEDDNSIIFRARPAIPHKEKDYIWNCQEKYIHRIVTVKYQELHQDTGIPRFPVVIKIHPKEGKK